MSHPEPGNPTAALQRPRRSHVVTCCVAVAVVLMTGCTVTVTSDGIDPAKVEASILDNTGETVKLQCPGEIPYQAGLVTTCPATADGANAIVVITQIDDKGDIDWSLGKTLKTDALPAVIEAELGVPVEIDCPEEVPLEKGLTIECYVSDGESEGTLLVTQKDNLGTIEWNWYD
jgi:hypothetical protein